jgi:7-cyano-7-deazaguanine synthase in queuosine biosynthesis
MLYEIIQHKLKPLIQSNKDLGFYISGGIDSTVLLYTCCRIKADTGGNARFHAFTIPTGHDTAWAHRVINWMKNNFQIDIDQTVVNFDKTLPGNHRVRSTLGVASQMCDHILLGDTTNPSAIRPGPERILSKDPRFVQPMFDWTKREVIALSQEINMPDELMIITNSCDNDNTCGHCWACTERAWGFAANDLSDPKLVAMAGIEPATNGV